MPIGKVREHLLDVAILVMLAVALVAYLRPDAPASPGERMTALSTRLTGKVMDRRVHTGVGQPTLYFVFNTTCTACARQRPVWLNTADFATAHGVSVRALAMVPEGEATDTASVTAYLSAREAIATSILADRELQESIGGVATPLFILVSSSGEILFHRLGVLSARDLDSLHTLLATVRP